jgi:hypothetical protein
VGNSIEFNLRVVDGIGDHGRREWVSLEEFMEGKVIAGKGQGWKRKSEQSNQNGESNHGNLL